MPSSSPRRFDARMVAAFFAGQAVMLGLVCLLRPYAAHADNPAKSSPTALTSAAEPPPTTSGAFEGEALMLHKGTGSGSLELYGEGAGGGPSISFRDAKGDTKMQISVDATGRPVILMRDKAGKLALALGLQNDEPTIAARGAKGNLVTVPLPKE